MAGRGSPDGGSSVTPLPRRVLAGYAPGSPVVGLREALPAGFLALRQRPA